jgi:hypothetical protein
MNGLEEPLKKKLIQGMMRISVEFSADAALAIFIILSLFSSVSRIRSSGVFSVKINLKLWVI